MKSRAVFLNPGDWIFSEEPALVETILGSCVALVLRSRSGAACVAHCILPRWDGASAPGVAGKFVDLCLAEMLAYFARLGAPRRHIEAKLFGGADVLARKAKRSVGRANVETARDILDRERIRISACEVGGTRGRKILVDTGSGDVYVQLLPRAARKVNA